MLKSFSEHNHTLNHPPLSPSSTTMYHTSDMTVTISGGSLEENQQMCTAVRKALQTVGFKNVEVEQSSEFQAGCMPEESLLPYMRIINPDLLDTSLMIYGESQEAMDVEFATLSRAVALGGSGMPSPY